MRYTFRAFAAAFILLCACSENKPDQKDNRVSPPTIKTPPHERPQLSNLDKSPMDMIYYPPDYPVLKMSGKIKDLPVARVIYSRPIKDGRAIFGNVIKYGSYWRLGANESTEIEFFQDVLVTGKPVKKGRYIMYCIPEKDKWTIKLNNDLYTWGLKVHNTGDIYSFDVPTVTMTKTLDVFTMEFIDDTEGAKLIMGWDSVRAALPIAPKNKKGSE